MPLFCSPNPLTIILLMVTTAFAGAPKTADFAELAKLYIDQYQHIAIQEMERSGIPASITLAQAMLESGFGQSELAQKANNHFGIKCQDNWTGKTINHLSPEVFNGIQQNIESCFRAYDKVEASFKDHSDYLMHRGLYDFIFIEAGNDYKKWAQGLSKAGYATDPAYAAKLIRTIETYNLAIFDVVSSKVMSEPEIPAYASMDTQITSFKNRITELYQIIEASNKEKEELQKHFNLEQNKVKKIEKQQKIQDDKWLSKIEKCNNQIQYQQSLITTLEKKIESLKIIQQNIIATEVISKHIDAEGKVKKNIFPEVKLNSRSFFYNHEVKTTLIQNGTDLYTLADQFGVSIADLCAFNDLESLIELPDGYYIYLEPKNNKVKTAEIHQVGINENMLMISQLYGIKLDLLLKRNHMIRGEEPVFGEFIFLNKKNKLKPYIK